MVECATIRDLLPLYVDDCLSEESNALISGHLAACESCRNEFHNMQSEIKKLQPDNSEKVDLLKGIKKKIFKQKVFIAVAACIVTLAVAIGGFYGIFHYATPIEYTEGFVWVQHAETHWDDGTTSINTSVMCAKEFYDSHATSRIINVDGTETEIMFIYVTGTLSTRRWPNSRGSHSIHFDFAYDNMPFPIEIYYLVAPFGEWSSMGDEEFYEQRHSAVLLWRGTIE